MARLEPLWLDLHAHHQEIAPELAPFVGDEASWAVRSALYAQALNAGGFALVAREHGMDAGYAIVAIEPAPWPATLISDQEVAELLTLAVRPGMRGRGVGGALLDAVDARLDAEGRDDRLIGVVPANTRAEALYARRGYVPSWLGLTRFGRPAPAAPRAAPLPIETVAVEEVDALAPLWLSLHHHHQSIAPALGPFVPDAQSWEVTRTMLVASAEQRLLLRAGPAEAPLAMACLKVDRDDPLWADTWKTGRDVAEIKLLVVAEKARGSGLGSALMDAVDSRLAADGVHDQVIGVVVGNADATRLYERRGYRPAWLQMSRFARRFSTP